MTTSTPVETLTAKEGEAVLRAFSSRAPTGVRNRALVGVMWYAGLRSAEARALLLRDIDLESQIVHVRHGKGDKSRKIGLNDRARYLIEVWLTARAKKRRIESQLVFCTLLGAHMSGQYLRRAVAKAGQRAGVERRVHPHVFRHMFAVELAQRSVPLTTIQQALGHADVTITARYLAHLYPAQVITATRGY